MRKYQLEVLYPWDSKWFVLDHLPVFRTLNRAKWWYEDQRDLYGSGSKVRIRNIKTDTIVWE